MHLRAPRPHRALRLLLLATAAALPNARASVDWPERLYTTEHPAMATRWQLLLYAADAQTAADLSDEVFEEVDRIEDLLSNYRDSSELSRINQQAAARPIVTDPETFSFLQAAQHWSTVSGGAFDLTVGPLMKSWGFFRKQGTVPDARTLARLRRRIGFRNVQLDPQTRSVHFRQPGVELDPGGIGKGFAVDAALRLLRSHGVQAAMLSAGSSTIGTLGAPPDAPGWRINAHDPWQPGHDVSYSMLRDSTLSTANCAENNFTLAGHRYCHIMNPHTLRPVENVLQVTVTDPSGTASDALSNILFVLPVQRSVRLLLELPRDSALIVTGTQDSRVCTAIRWRQPIAPGFCSRLVEVQ